jgi:hypothetical protein
VRGELFMSEKSLIRNDVGARNPYSIIENLEMKKINWKKKPRDEIRFLFNKHFDMKLEDVFGSADSPLFHKTGAGSMLSGCTDAWTDYVDYPNGVYLSGTPHPDDVVQGCVPDCYYLASLYSTAWVKPATITDQKPPFNFTFYYPPGTPDNTSAFPIPAPGITVDKAQLPLKKITQPDSSVAYNFVYARSTTPSNEIWPSVFEKAYAKFIGVRSADGDLDHPDISQIGEGSAFQTLVNLTGLNLVLDDKTSLTANYSSGDDIFTTIQSKMCTAGVKKAAKPGVAYTYRNGPYSDDKLVANHTYSILGWHQENSKNYIVLRNPYGPTWYKDPRMYDDQGSLARLGWAPAGRRLDKEDGIFGLRADLFLTYFEAFNWVG